MQFPPLCTKGRQGGVEASRGWASFYLPTPLLTKEGGPEGGHTPLPQTVTIGGTPLGITHVLPSTHTISGRTSIGMQELTAMSAEPDSGKTIGAGLITRINRRIQTARRPSRSQWRRSRE